MADWQKNDLDPEKKLDENFWASTQIFSIKEKTNTNIDEKSTTVKY